MARPSLDGTLISPRASRNLLVSDRTLLVQFNVPWTEQKPQQGCLSTNSLARTPLTRAQSKTSGRRCDASRHRNVMV